jgi:hypothetical protein
MFLLVARVTLRQSGEECRQCLCKYDVKRDTRVIALDNETIIPFYYILTTLFAWSDFASVLNILVRADEVGFKLFILIN